MVLSSRNHVPKITLQLWNAKNLQYSCLEVNVLSAMKFLNLYFLHLVVLLLGETLDAGHEDIVVSEEAVQDELGEGVAEARVVDRIQNLDVDGDIQLLPGGGGQPQEADLEAVLHDVLVLRPHDLRQLLDVTELDKEKIMSILR